MKKIELLFDEVILFEGIVKYGKLNKKTKLTLTNKRMIFEKEKGLFKKYLSVFEEVYINNIKVYKEQVQIKQNKEIVTIQAIDKNINISCSNNVDAKRIVEEIINIRTGSTSLERNKNKINKALNSLSDIIDIGKKIIPIVGGIAIAFGGKDIKLPKWIKLPKGKQ